MTLKVMTVLGTRPEIIRLSRVMPALDRSVDHFIVHTGQNYDSKLNEVFFDEMGLRPPDVILETNHQSLGHFLASTLIEVENELRRVKPDAVLILGDTNSSIAAIIARRQKIPVYHMEAGNRCFDENVPEEVNRRMIDHIADFNLVYTEHARRNLLSEGLHPRRIYLTGSPLREVLEHYRDSIDRSEILESLGVEKNGFFLVSLHREETVDNPLRLRMALDTIEQLQVSWNLPVIISTHPRTRKQLLQSKISLSPHLRLEEPFGYFDYNKLQCSAKCVLSDSGTIAEEASILGFSAITLRESIERPEALDSASIIITGLDSNTVCGAVDEVSRETSGRPFPLAPDDYQISNCSQRVVRLILGTAKLSRSWSNYSTQISDS